MQLHVIYSRYLPLSCISFHATFFLLQLRFLRLIARYIQITVGAFLCVEEYVPSIAEITVLQESSDRNSEERIAD